MIVTVICFGVTAIFATLCFALGLPFYGYCNTVAAIINLCCVLVNLRHA